MKHWIYGKEFECAECDLYYSKVRCRRFLYRARAACNNSNNNAGPNANRTIRCSVCVRCFKAALFKPSPMRSNRHFKRVNTATQFDVLVHYQVKYDYGIRARAIGNVTGLAGVCIEPKNYALSKFNENQFHLCAARDDGNRRFFNQFGIRLNYTQSDKRRCLYFK